MVELTSNVNTENLTEVEVMGRSVFVSQTSEKAYVPFEDELVSMTDLRAWNHLMESAKKEVIDGYQKDKIIEELEVIEERERISNKLREMSYEIGVLAGEIAPKMNNDN